MKKFNLTFVFCLTVFFLSAQDYLVTFFGSGESTSVSTVIVENMTQGKSLTLNGKETLHLKNDVNKISDLEYNQTEGIQFYPNPMKEFSVLEFAMPEEGAAKIELFDISGRKLTQTQNYLNPGRHSYRITGVGNGIYVLKVTAGNYLYSGKLISEKKTGEMVHITYENTIRFNDNAAVTKSAKSEILMQYNTGDALKFFATGGEHKSVKVEVISESKNIDFVFYKCTDPDNRNYATVKIGDQVWMAENLAYLPAVGPPTGYVYGYTGTDVAAAKDNQNYKDYGVLYDWPAALNACPPGWHLPSDDEWTALTTWLGESVAGDKMKATSGWYDNGNGNNISGFSALPGGLLNYNRDFDHIAKSGFWWSSTERNEYYAWLRSLMYDYDHVIRHESFLNNYLFKGSGFSVRCVKDSVPPNSFTDPRDNKTYKTVKIGNQEWMAENLAYLPAVSPPDSGSSIVPRHYVYGYIGTDEAAAKDNQNYKDYGVLYNWQAAKAVCPPGWHLPSDAEWTALTTFLGGESVAGGNLKESGYTHWHSPNIGATNKSGFSALPGGYRSSRGGGAFYAVGNTGFWWSSNGDTYSSMARELNYNTSYVSRYGTTTEYGFSVRCVKDSVPPNSFTDPRDNKTYKTVKIGNQEWMAENLAYLPAVSPPDSGSSIVPRQYVYGFIDTDEAAAKDNQNYKDYGVLYNWPAAKVACPPGWHLPSDDEWKQLEIALGMTQDQVDATGWRGTDQGTQMKATSGWNSNGNGTNSSGFAALPAGSRLSDGMSGIGGGGVWWSSTEANTSGAYGRGMNYIYGNVYRDYIGKEDGFSVRCVRDN
jgi:uncharacterized protein (TIGR02145 family)